jgi:flagellin
MSLTINTNVAAMNAQRMLGRTQNALNRSIQRLSSGLRINSAKDDAAGLAISTRMGSEIRGLNQAARNANDGISMAQTAEGALQESSNLLQRIRELAIQSANDSNSAMDRDALNDEAQSLLAEAQRISVTTEFNGKSLIDGTLTGAQFHVGAYANQTITVNVGNAQNNNLGSYQVTTGLTNVTNTSLAAGDVLINGIDVGASVDGSAESKATAINGISDQTGVTATATTELTSANALVRNQAIQAGDLNINGVNIGAVAGSNNLVAQGENIANAINALSNQTGIQAVHNQSTGALTLSSSSGSNIEITSTNGTPGYSRLENASGLEVSASTEQAQSTYTLANGTVGSNALTVSGYDTNDITTQTALDGETIEIQGITFEWEGLANGVTGSNVAIDITGVITDDSGLAAALNTAIDAQITAGTLTQISTAAPAAVVTITSLASTITMSHLTATISAGAGIADNEAAGTGLAAGNTLAVGGVTYEFVLNAGDVTTGNVAVVLGADDNAIAASLDTAIDGQYSAGNTNIQSSVALAVVTITSDLLGTPGNSTVDGTPTTTGATANSLDEDLAGGNGTATDGDGTDLNGLGELELNSASSFLITGTNPGKAGLANAAVSQNSINNVDISSATGANEAIALLDGALSQLTSIRGNLGAVQNRFESTIANLLSTSENISAARARIIDADFAVETAALSKAQIMQQAGIAMLAQANQLPQAVLGLLQ